MLGAIASAALLVAASLIVGHAILLAFGRRAALALAGPVGLSFLLVVSGLTAAPGASGPGIAIALAVVSLGGAAVALVGGGSGKFRRSLRSRTARTLAGMDAKPAPTGLARFAAPATAGLLAAGFAAIPFVVSGQVGILGVGLVNDDMASHLLLADWIDERFRPEPVLVDQGYPLGPHALVAGLTALTGASTVDAFAGLILALPALTAMAAFGALGGLRTWLRVAVSALVAVPYLAAAYLAQEAFKEPMLALFVLGFALLLPSARSARGAVPLGILAAGTVYVYSFPGLAWLAGTALAWGAIEVLRGRRPSRSAWLAVAAGAVAALVLVLPDVGRVLDFRDFRALDPDTANEGGLGNLRAHISPLEALGIWPTSEFRLSVAASSVPAVVFYACGLLGALAFALGLPRWLRRRGPAIPAALATALILYAAARTLGTVYTSAKALAIAAPFITLITLGGLLSSRAAEGTGNEGEGSKEPADRQGSREGEDKRSSKEAAGKRSSREGEGKLQRSLRSRTARTLADMDVKPAPKGLAFLLPTLALLVGIGTLASSFLILRQAPVAPTAHAEELEQIRPIVQGKKLLFLGRDNFILWELRGSKPFTAVRNFYNPYYVQPNLALEQVFSKFDFDSVTGEDLARFPYVLTPDAAYQSSPPPGYELEAETDSYRLWARGDADPSARRPGETDAAPGREGGCPAGEPPRAVAAFGRTPVVAPGWSDSTIENGSPTRLTLDLPAGDWELSLRYDSTRPLTISAQGRSATLPGNLDYRGSNPFWDAGLTVSGPGPVEIGAEVQEPPFAGRALGAKSVAHLGAVAATGHRPRARPSSSGCDAYVDWYER